jgi:signal transduction histidine kinase
VVSVSVSEILAHRVYGNEPDWTALATAADERYIAGGTPALLDWQGRISDEHIDAWLFEGNRNLTDRRPPVGPLADILPTLLMSENIVMHPRPELFIVSQRVTGSDGVERRLIAERAPRPREHLRRLLRLQVGLSLLAIGIVSWFITRGIARPVRALSQAARGMADGALSTRVDERWTRSQDEVGALARDFNTMAARIEALIDHERGVLQDVSHELRSPLARLQLHLELARRASPAPLPQLERADAEVARVDRLLTEILALTRLEAALPGMTREPVDLAALARARVAEAGQGAGGLNASIEADAAVFVSGSAPLLERAIDNLLANALKYGHRPDEAETRIDLSVRSSGPHAILRVRDHGPGVAQADLPSLFRPFFRGANAGGSQGQGLGLAAVARIAAAHGGEVRACNATGGGLEVCLQLPLAAGS